MSLRSTCLGEGRGQSPMRSSNPQFSPQIQQPRSGSPLISSRASTPSLRPAACMGDTRGQSPHRNLNPQVSSQMPQPTRSCSPLIGSRPSTPSMRSMRSTVCIGSSQGSPILGIHPQLSTHQQQLSCTPPGSNGHGSMECAPSLTATSPAPEPVNTQMRTRCGSAVLSDGANSHRAVLEGLESLGAVVYQPSSRQPQQQQQPAPRVSAASIQPLQMPPVSTATHHSARPCGSQQSWKPASQQSPQQPQQSPQKQQQQREPSTGPKRSPQLFSAGCTSAPQLPMMSAPRR